MTARRFEGASALVTGATGLVGRALVRLLESEGARVTGLHRGTAAAGGIRVRSYDPEVVRSAVRGLQVDYAFHLGAYGVKPHEAEPLELIRGNAGVTAAVLDALAEAPPRRFLFAGSSAQYRPVDPPKLLSEDCPQQPLSLYGVAKYSAEQTARLLARKHGIWFVSLRLFGVYGPGESPHRLIPHLARTIASGLAPELSAGEQARDWVFVEDVAEAFAAAAAADELGHDAYNVCSGAGVKVRDVASLVGRAASGHRLTDEQLGLGRKSYRADEAMWLVGDPSRFAAATGWRATTPLEKGVQRTVEWALANPQPLEAAPAR